MSILVVWAAALQSGSRGNCIYVQSGEVHLLFDAGVGRRVVRSRLEAFGRRLEEVTAIVISHDHRDHVCGAGILQRASGAPLWVTPPTLSAARRRMDLGRLGAIEPFSAGDTLRLGPVSVETVPTAHDAVDGVGFVVCAEGRRLGILTDLGHVFDPLPELLTTLDAVFLESNYDPALLERGPYPDWLKRRIAGPAGHLSNEQCAALLAIGVAHRLRWACLAHLSEENNRPDVALRAHRALVRGGLPVHVASRTASTPLFEL